MSGPAGVAAVTSALRALLERGVNAELPGTDVTVRPLDKARVGEATNQVNLFLFNAAHNASWRNRDLPDRVRPGESGFPPLVLDLSYLVTVFGRDNDDVLAHRLLGKAMSVLHDHPVLGEGEVAAAWAEPGLGRLVENVRIVPQPMSTEELSKLWSAFQTQYRTSVSYLVSTVVIESTRPSRTAPPVLSRGPDDRGVAAVTGTLPPYPAVDAVRLPGPGQPSAEPGDEVVLVGHHLDGDTVEVVAVHRAVADPVVIAPTAAGAHEVRFAVPDDAAGFPAGLWGVQVRIRRAGSPTRTTGRVPLAVAPIVSSITPDPAARDATGAVALTLTFRPDLRPAQEAAVLVGDREVVVGERSTAVGTVTVDVPDAVPGPTLVRLRVEGVDSHLLDYGATPRAFDASQRVEVT